MNGFGDNFVEATMATLQDDTDVDWRPRVPQWPAIGDTMATAIQSALSGQATVKAALDDAPAPYRTDDARLSPRLKPAPVATAGNATAIAASDLGRVLAQRERRFAAALLAPAFLALLATTTFPLLFLVWTSAFRMDLAMPFTDGFVGLENYRALLTDDRFWSSLLVSLVYTGSTVVLQVAHRPGAGAAGDGHEARPGLVPRRSPSCRSCSRPLSSA